MTTLLLFISTTNAQDDDEEGDVINIVSAPKVAALKDFNTKYEKSATPKILIDSIDPERGPLSGETRVTVRGGPLSIWEVAYPKPVCKFGNHEPVTAAYTSCTFSAYAINEKEARHRDRLYRCLSCDFSPIHEVEGPIPFQVSLTGDFSDSMNSVQFYYYKNPVIDRIQPRYGPKDGGTPVKFWGQNFKDFNGKLRCSFGTKTVPANVKNDTYLECFSAQSDVVSKAMPVAITLNDQQFTKSSHFYWYYNWPSIKELVPTRGPEAGGTTVELRGQNFYPFKEILDEVDNAVDVYCAFLELKRRVPAIVYNATRAECVSPASYYFHQSVVELTLNGEEYTEDENIFYYYKPPLLYDLDPREGPVRVATLVSISGTGFENTGSQIKCQFGTEIVPGTYVSPQLITCLSPKRETPGYVPLRVALKENLWSTALQYLYYDTPIVGSFSPTCGPDFGYTQIEVVGENFIDLGSNKAMCVFNKTIFTNATIFSDTLLYCDSPVFLNPQGYSLLGSNGDDGNWYEVGITIDGGVAISNTGKRFYYYKQPQITGISPYGGPLKGKTPVSVKVTGAEQTHLCEISIRFSTTELHDILVVIPNELRFAAPSASYPGTVVVQVSFNGQQYTNERINHLKDPLASYEYYTDPLITFHHPHLGPSTGNTKVKIQGLGFATNKQQEFSDPKNLQAKNRLWARFVDIVSKAPLFQDQEIQNFRNDEAIFNTPPQPANTQALLQISKNRVDWTDVKDPSPLIFSSFSYYAAPHIIKLSPSFGPVKPENDTDLTISGSDFTCPNGNCKNLKCRFEEPDGDKIYTPCNLVSSSSITAKIPKYTTPDVLKVEVSMNGIDFTNDNKTYGYFDPYLIDAQPRLISINGTTIVTLTGIGFVDSGTIYTKYQNNSNDVACDGKPCIKNAKFIDASHIETSTFAQSQLIYSKSSNSIMWDAIEISASVYSNEFTYNNILLYYIHDVKYKLLSFPETPANIPANLKIDAQINPNDLDLILKYGKPMCRFTGNGNVMYTDGFIDNNQVSCVTPVWTQGACHTKLDVSLNGFDFSGDIDFKIGDPLLLHRVSLMAGPVEMSTLNVKLLGQGFRPNESSLQFQSKWGVLGTNSILSSAVFDYKYYFDSWLTIEQSGNHQLQSYWNEATNWPRVDSKLDDGTTYNMYKQPSYKLTTNINGHNYNVTQGGPFYLEVGRDIKIEQLTQIQGSRLLSESNVYTYYEYSPAAVEFYQYKQCTMLGMHPKHGLTAGGTAVQVVGFDYRYMPEWGVVPHCKFGEKVVRAHFDSSVRLVCFSPPNDEPAEAISFEVSLNGFDWTSTGFTYSYYREPELYSYYPDAGASQGGTTIYISGKNLPKISNQKEFNARFTPQSGKMGIKTMPIEWVNDTMIKVITPGGWSQGDVMDFQITFNGADYDKNNFTFTFYNIAQVTPRSGPSDGQGGEIIISGQGFRLTDKPICRMNNTVYDATSFTWTEIRCPIPPAEDGPDYFGNVDFAVSANNGADWHVYQGGFQYYQQPIVDDISPKTGPAHGVGVINFYGSGFRADYALADLKCKVGNNIGVAIFVSKNQIRCVVEDMELVPQGQRLPAQVSLNGQSWTATNDHPDDTGSTFYVPYSVNAIFPNSGRQTGGSEVLIIGSGFVESEQNTPRCRFGIPTNYKIVQAQIVSYNKMVCISPPMPDLKGLEILPLETPFSIALTQDSFDPWTYTHHRFRYYKSPVIARMEPTEVQVGLITEIELSIDAQTGADNVFFEPFPAEAGKFDLTNGDDASDDQTALLMGNQIKCKFGRFGETLAVYVNETSVKCVTPSVLDDPEDIYRETVDFSIAMNGYDYDYDAISKDFTFIGTGAQFGMAPTIIAILLGGVLLVAFILFVQSYFTFSALRVRSDNNQPQTSQVGDLVQPNYYPYLRNPASRGGSRPGNLSQSYSRGGAGQGQFNN